MVATFTILKTLSSKCLADTTNNNGQKQQPLAKAVYGKAHRGTKDEFWPNPTKKVWQLSSLKRSETTTKTNITAIHYKTPTANPIGPEDFPKNHGPSRSKKLTTTDKCRTKISATCVAYCYIVIHYIKVSQKSKVNVHSTKFKIINSWLFECCFFHAVPRAFPFKWIERTWFERGRTWYFHLNGSNARVSNVVPRGIFIKWIERIDRGKDFFNIKISDFKRKTVYEAKK